MAPRTLRAGALELVIDAERGGSIMRLRDEDFDLMRAWDGVTDSPLAYACFPLVPFSGLVDHARFTFAGRCHELEPDPAHRPHAIHGDGWTSPWRLVAAGADRAVIELVRDRPGSAFRYRAEQRFALLAGRLEVGLSVTNRAEAPMPFGLGLHPWFDRRPGTLLSAEVGGVWQPDADNLPRRREPVPVPWGFRLRRPVAELALDHEFEGWSGTARIDWPDAGRALEIEASGLFRHLVVYVPPAASFFCIEPVSHVADGFNLMAAGFPDTGVRILAPGETMSGLIRFVPLRKSWNPLLIG
ncbi:aldose 1-epimerase [Benzoatithermus flavus]|uniref:Aldose 1-epimerase n=1 Tax=Benzoatithermus flavus TaxID=3108223 RepID=A0ABU8XXH2_9PROT